MKRTNFATAVCTLINREELDLELHCTNVHCYLQTLIHLHSVYYRCIKFYVGTFAAREFCMFGMWARHVSVTKIKGNTLLFRRCYR